MAFSVRFDDDDDDDEFHKNTSGSSHAQCQNKRELCKRIDSVGTIPMEEKEVDDSHGVEVRLFTLIIYVPRLWISAREGGSGG